MERQNLAQGILTISDVLMADECQQMIALAEERGFDAAPIKSFDVEWLDERTRNNDRVIVNDFELERLIWSRAGEFVPRMLAGLPVQGLNNYFRFYRYAPGQRFSWHYDRSFGAQRERSLLTFMIYLNEGYKGGATRFESLSVAGKLGMALVFEHGLLHEGAEVTGGVKYVLRSDVMYGARARRTPVETVNYLTSRWRYYEDFYRDHDHEGMAAFIARIAPLAIAQQIYPNNRHWWLGLHKYDMRAAYLLCDKDGVSFGITWYEDFQPVKTEGVDGLDGACWQRIVNWLDLQETNRSLTTA